MIVFKILIRTTHKIEKAAEEGFKVTVYNFDIGLATNTNCGIGEGQGGRNIIKRNMDVVLQVYRVIKFSFDSHLTLNCKLWYPGKERRLKACGSSALNGY